MIEGEDQPTEKEDASPSSGMPDVSNLMKGSAASGVGGIGAAGGGSASSAIPAVGAAGGGSTGGMIQDTVRMAKSAGEGNAMEAADAGLDVAATGAATYFGGEAGGQAARFFLNSAPGKATKKGVIWLIAILAGAMVMTVMSAGMSAVGVVGIAAGGGGSAAACYPLGGDMYSGGKGGIWAMKFLHAQGLRGEPLRVMWAIVMRESSGDPTNRTPESGTYDNGTFDAGLFQTNSTNADSLAEYGLTMDDAFNPDLAFNFWMRRASPDRKLMSNLAMWGLYSWNNTTLNASQYLKWTAEQHQEWIVEPFERYMRQVNDAARQASITIGSSMDSKVVLQPLGPKGSVTLHVTGGIGTLSVDNSDNSRSETEPGRIISQVSAVSEPGSAWSIPESSLTVSNHEALKPGDPRLTTFTVANRKITVHEDFKQLFTDFLNAWDRNPVLGQGRLNISKGEGPLDSYEYRPARANPERWSDHAGYAVDIRYDLLPAFSGYQMTTKERNATKELLKEFPEIGWGGNYTMKYMDEMHFYVISGASPPAQQWSDGCMGGGSGEGGFSEVPPGASVDLLYGKETALPQVGFTINTPGGRNMMYYNQGDPRWPQGAAYDFATCGCGTTSVAMVIATLKPDTEYTPVKAYREQDVFPEGCGSYHSSLTRMARNNDLVVGPEPSWGQVDWPLVRKTLQKGGLVIISVKAGTAFFDGAGHFVVIRGYTADGKYLIADPGSRFSSYTGGYTPSQFNVNSGASYYLPPGGSFS